MSTKNEIDDGGPAFPAPHDGTVTDGESVTLRIEIESDAGMSLRDYFAAKCLNALTTAEITDAISDWRPETIAADAYAIADAMLVARRAK